RGEASCPTRSLPHSDTSATSAATRSACPFAASRTPLSSQSTIPKSSSSKATHPANPGFATTPASSSSAQSARSSAWPPSPSSPSSPSSPPSAQFPASPPSPSPKPPSPPQARGGSERHGGAAHAPHDRGS